MLRAPVPPLRRYATRILGQGDRQAGGRGEELFSQITSVLTMRPVIHVLLPTLVILYILLQNRIFLHDHRDSLLYTTTSRICRPLYLSSIQTTHVWDPLITLLSSFILLPHLLSLPLCSTSSVAPLATKLLSRALPPSRSFPWSHASVLARGPRRLGSSSRENCPTSGRGAARRGEEQADDPSARTMFGSMRCCVGQIQI